MKRIARSGWAIAAVTTAALVFNTFSGINMAGANHLPADKPFAAASKAVRFGPGTKVPLLTATVKNSKPTDMVLQLSMECSIVTDTILLGSPTGGAKESTRAEGTVRAWIEVDDQIVPIVSASSPPQTPTQPGDATDKVTFCNRVFERTVEDKEEQQDGIDSSRDYISTKTANSFNWVRLNMGSGVHKIAVYADLEQAATGSSAADAYVGNRSLIGVPGKFANDAVISEGATG